MATRAGYARTARLWRRGADPLAAPVLFETGEQSMAAWGEVDRYEPGRLVFAEKPGFFDTGVLDRRRGRTTAAARSAHGRVAILECQDWLTVRLRTPWTIERAGGIPPGALLGVGLRAFLEGDRRFETLFAPGERRALQHSLWAGGRLLVQILDDLQPVTEILAPSATGWARGTLQGLPGNSAS